MKITPTSTEAVDLSKVFEKREAAAPAAAPASSPAATSSQVSLSDLSGTLQSLEARFATEPAFDAKRVQQIKDAIRSGQFRVNPEAIADRLIESVREIVGKPHG